MAEIQFYRPPRILNSAIAMANLAAIKRNQDTKRVMANAALLQQANAARKLQRKEALEASDFTLNVLTGVNSQEDLDKAKSILISRYPEDAKLINTYIPSTYDPGKIDLIRNALRTSADRIRAEELKAPKAFSAGSDIYQGGKKIGHVPSTPPQPSFDLFTDKDGNQVYIKKGEVIPKGYKKVQKSGVNVSINTGDLTKPTTTKLQGDIVEATRNIQSFRRTRSLFKPEYLTLFGKGKKLAAETADKLGISSKEQKKLIRDRSKWFRQAKADFIAYRKWATGVAGGEKELREIATSFPDPVNNSPEQYKANLDSIEETTKKVLALNKEFLRSGIDLNQPLDKVLEQAKAVGVTPPPSDKVVIIRYDKNGNRL